MNLNQLYYFKKLAELQHYTKAAQELYISQPSLSFAISSLEKELDIGLFRKKGRNVVLTKYGEEFYKYVTASLTELDKGLQHVKNKSSLQTGSIDIGCIPTLTGDFIPKAIRKFITSFQTQTNFNLFHGMSLEILEGVKEGKYDLGFCSKIENEPDLVFLPMLYQELVVITQENHKLATKDHITMTEIIDYPLITYRHTLPIGKMIMTLFHEQDLEPTISHALDDEISIGGLVSEGFGIAIVANTPLLRQFNIATIPLDARLDSRIVYLTYNANQYRTQAVQSFINFMVMEQDKSSITFSSR
ncbi:HTH-type transcriptional regulator GltC [compost metagenome]